MKLKLGPLAVTEPNWLLASHSLYDICSFLHQAALHLSGYRWNSFFKKDHPLCTSIKPVWISTEMPNISRDALLHREISTINTKNFHPNTTALVRRENNYFHSPCAVPNYSIFLVQATSWWYRDLHLFSASNNMCGNLSSDLSQGVCHICSLFLLHFSPCVISPVRWDVVGRGSSLHVSQMQDASALIKHIFQLLQQHR